MAHYTLTLNYTPTGFLPDPKVLGVQDGDTFSFQLGTAPPNSTFLVKMDPQYFSPAEAKDSDTKVTVVKAAISEYSCHLSDVFGSPLSSGGQAGGSTRPGGPKAP
jgi:hypothetical protein